MTLYLNPYEIALQYRNNFWKGVIPLPLKEKHPPPVGFTGHAAQWPTLEQIDEWIHNGRHNIGLRLAGVDDDHEVIGIDVDHYTKGERDKHGGDQLRGLEVQLGPLPETWISSSRADGISGIRFFRVPRGLAFPGQIAKDIECISKGYRFVVVYPSIHPLGAQYVWFPPGAPLTALGAARWDGELPLALELPLLPEKWLKHITQGKALTGNEQIMDRDSSVDEVYQWAESAFHGYRDDLCPTMRGKVDAHKKLIEEEATSFPLMIKAHQNIIHLASEGHMGCDKALAEISERYLSVCIVNGKREGGKEQIEGELFRSIIGALRKKKAKNGPVLTQCDKPGGLCNTNGQTAPPHTFTNDKRLGQLRLAHMFSEKFDGKLIYVHAVGWHYWDGQRWDFDDRGKAYRAVIKILEIAWNAARTLPKDDKKRLLTAVNGCQTHNGITSILSIASKLKPFAVTVNDLDQDPYLLNVANGTLNLRNMDLQQHNPKDRITRVCRASYRPELVSTVWNGFLEKVLPDQDVRDYLQRLTGVALLGAVKEHLLAILTGQGRNGKGTWYEAVLWAIGDYGAVAEPDLFMHREGAHPAGQMALRGNRLVVVSENDRNRRLAEATMKRLTGGDPITARFMHQNFVTFEPSHMAMLITNHLPKVNGDDPAVWARMRVIPFNVFIPPEERDTHMGERLRLEADAVLTWAIEGWQQYSQLGTAEPEAVLAATNRYREDSDDIGIFISECCATDSDGYVRQATTSELFGLWDRWQKENGSLPIGQRQFGRALDSKGHTVLPVNNNSRRERLGIGLPKLKIAQQT